MYLNKWDEVAAYEPQLCRSDWRPKSGHATFPGPSGSRGLTLDPNDGCYRELVSSDPKKVSRMALSA